jgi:hypothetical protein
MEVAEELEEGDNHTTINLHQNKCREMLAGGGAGGRSGIHSHGMEVLIHPTQQSTICWKGLEYRT